MQWFAFLFRPRLLEWPSVVIAWLLEDALDGKESSYMLPQRGGLIFWFFPFLRWLTIQGGLSINHSDPRTGDFECSLHKNSAKCQPPSQHGVWTFSALWQTEEPYSALPLHFADLLHQLTHLRKKVVAVSGPRKRNTSPSRQVVLSVMYRLQMAWETWRIRGLLSFSEFLSFSRSLCRFSHLELNKTLENS